MAMFNGNREDNELLDGVVTPLHLTTNAGEEMWWISPFWSIVSQYFGKGRFISVKPAVLKNLEMMAQTMRWKAKLEVSEGKDVKIFILSDQNGHD